MFRRRRVFYGKPVIKSYGSWKITISASSTTVANSGGSVILTPTAEREVYWSNKEVTIETGIPTLDSPSLGQLSNGTNLIIPANHTENTINITVVAKIDDVTETIQVATQDKNRPSYIEYSKPAITANYADKTAAAGTVTPSISYTQKRTQHWESSPEYTTALSDINVTVDDNYTSYSIVTSSGASVNASTGILTWTANTNEVDRSAVVRVTVNRNNVSNYIEVTATQTADEIDSYSYDVPTVTFDDYVNKNASAGSVNISLLSYKQIRTNNWVSGQKTTTELTSGGTIKYSGSATGATLNTTTGKVTWTANTDASNSRSIVVTATVTMNDKEGKDTATSTQLKDAISSQDFTIPTVTFNNYVNVDAKSQSVSVSSISYKQTRTDNWVSGKASTTTELTSGGTIKYKYSGSATYATVNESTGVVTWVAQSGNTNNRSIEVEATVTMNGKEGKDTATSTQLADYRVISSYNIPTITFNDYVKVDAKPQSVSVSSISYSQVVNLKWYSDDSSAGTRTGTIGSVTYNESSTEGHSDATVNESTGAVTWTANTDASNSRSCKVIVTVVGEGNKSNTAPATSTQEKDMPTTINYGTPVVTFNDYAIKNAAAGPVSVSSISYTQSRTQNWVSGKTPTSLSALTSSGVVTYAESSTEGHSDATVNESTGAVTWTANTDASNSRSCKVEATVTMNGKSGKDTATSTQEEDKPTTINYGTPVVTFNDYAIKNAAAGPVSVSSISYTQSRTQNWVSGKTPTSLSALTSGGVVTYAESSTEGHSDATVNESTGAVTWTANTDDSNSRSCKVEATVTINGKEGKNTATSTQEEDKPTTINYGIPVVTFNDYVTKNATAGSVTPNISYTQSRTQNWVSGKTPTSLPSLSATVDDEYTEFDYVNFDGNVQNGATIDPATGKITWTANTSEENREVKVIASVTRNGKTGTSSIPAKAKQTGDEPTTITYGNPIISDFSYTPKNANEGTVTPVIKYTQSRTQNWLSGRTTTMTALSATADDSYTTYKEKTDVSGVSVNTSTGVLTWTDNTSTSNERSVTIVATVSRYSKTGTKEATAIQSKDELIDTTITYDTPTITSITLDNDIPASGGTTSASYFTVKYSQVKTTTNHYIHGDEATNETLTGTATDAQVTMVTNVTGSNLGSDPKDRTNIGTATLKITINNKTSANGTCVVYQQANAITKTEYVPGAYTGTLFLSSTSNLSASTDSRTVTYGKVYRTKTPVYTWTSTGTSTGTSENEYYSGTVALSLAVNAGISYCSLTGSAANSSSSTSSATLSKSTYGTTDVNSQTYTISLRLGSTTGSVVKSITIKTTANKPTTINYGTPVVTFNNYGSKNAAAGSIGISATPTYSQSRTQNWTSGDGTTTLSNLTSGGTITYAESSTAGHTAATVNSTTGAVTWGANTSESSSRSVTVIATVTMNSKSGTGTAISTQDKDGISSYSFANPTVSLSYSNIAACTTTQSPTVSYNQVRTNNYISGKTSTTTNLTSGASSITYKFDTNAQGSATSINGSGVITWPINGATASARSCKVIATVTINGKSGSSSATTAQQNGDTSGSVTYSNPTVNLSYGTNAEPSANATQSPTLSYSQTKTTYWSCASGTVRTTETLKTGGTISYAESSTDGHTNATVNTSNGVVTWGSNTSSSTRSCKVIATVTMNKKSGSSSPATATQKADYVTSTTYSTPVVSLSYSDIAACTTTQSPTLSYSQTATYTWKSGKSNTTSTFTSGGSVSYKFYAQGSATSINSSGVITWPTNGASTSDRSCTVIATVTMHEKSGSNSPTTATQKADTSGSVTYSNPSVNLSYGTNAEPSANATQSPTLSYSQTKTTYWSCASGTVRTTETLKTGGSVSYTESANHDAATVASGTGVVTWGSNTSSSTRSCKVIATVTMNKKSGSSSPATATQKADYITSTTYSTPTVSLSYSDIAACTTTQSPTLSYSQTATYTWKSGKSNTTSTFTSGGSVSYKFNAQGSASSINGSGVITWPTNGASASDRSCTVIATVTMHEKSGSNSPATATQLADTSGSVTYSKPSVSLSYKTDAEPSANATQSPTLSYSQTKTTYWSCASSTVRTTETLTSGGSISYTESTNHNDATVNTSTGVVTWSTANTSTSSERTCFITATVTMHSQSGSSSPAKAAQRIDYISSYSYANPTVSLSYSNVAACTTTQSPSYSYNQVRTNHYKSGQTTTTNLTTGGSLSFKETKDHTSASVNASTGVVTWSSTNGASSSNRSCEITLTVTMHEKSGSSSPATARQNADTTGTVVRGTPTIRSFSYPDIAACTTSQSPDVDASATDTTYWYCASSTVKSTATASLSYSYTEATNHTAATVNASTGVVTWSSTNGASASDRSCVVTLTVKNSNDISETATKSTAATQLADIEGTVVRGTPTIRSFSYPDIAACTTSQSPDKDATATDTTYWNCASSTIKSTANASLSYSYAFNTQGSATGVNSSTGTITWPKNGASSSDRSCKVTLTVKNSNDMSKTKTSTVTATQLADTEGTIVRGTPTISLFSYPSVSACTTSQSPDKSASGTDKTYWSCASSTVKSTTNASLTYSYAETTDHTDASVNTSTGVVTWSSTNGASSSNRSCGVTLTVKNSNDTSKKATSTATAKQLADTTGTVVRGTPTISSFSYSNIAACTTSQSPLKNASATDTTYWTCASSTPKTTVPASLTYSYTFNTQGSATSVDSSTGKITWPKNSNSTSSRSCKVTLTVKNSNDASKTATKPATATQNADSYTTTYTYSNLACSLTNNLTAGGGSATVKVTATRTPNYDWVCGDSTTGTPSNNYDVTSSATKSINSQYFSTSSSASSGTSISRFSISGATISHSSMGTTAGYDYVSAKATFDGKTATSSTISVQNSYNVVYTLDEILSAQYPTNVSYSGGSVGLQLTYQHSVVKKWYSGEEEDPIPSTVTWNTGSGTLSNLKITSGTGATINTSTGEITWEANPNTSARSCTISGTLTHHMGGGSLNFTATSNQAAKPTSTTYRYYAKFRFYNNTGSGLAISIPIGCYTTPTIQSGNVGLSTTPPTVSFSTGSGSAVDCIMTFTTTTQLSGSDLGITFQQPMQQGTARKIGSYSGATGNNYTVNNCWTTGTPTQYPVYINQ